MGDHWWRQEGVKPPPAYSVMRTNPAYIGEDESLLEVAERLAGTEVREMPVCGPGGNVLGMLSQRDVIAKLVTAGIDPSTVTAREVATEDIVAIEPNDRVDVALRVMHEHDVHRLPVIEHNQLVGMIAMSDIIDHIPSPGGAA
jgi:CBS domain-containing protein